MSIGNPLEKGNKKTKYLNNNFTADNFSGCHKMCYIGKNINILKGNVE